MDPFWVSLCENCNICNQVHFFHRDIQLFQQLSEDIIFSSLNCIWLLCQRFRVWIYFWGLYSVLLIYVSILHWILIILICSFIVSLEICWRQSSIQIVFFQFCVYYSGSFAFPINTSLGTDCQLCIINLHKWVISKEKFSYLACLQYQVFNFKFSYCSLFVFLK